MTDEIRDTLVEALDDYTTDQRGDIGMLIRLAAIDAISAKCVSSSETDKAYLHDAMPRVARLASERMDKVRFAAWSCLEMYSRCYGELPNLSRYTLWPHPHVDIYARLIKSQILRLCQRNILN